MRGAAILLLWVSVAMPLPSQEIPEAPLSEKAKKTFSEALVYVSQHNMPAALDAFKRADKQDGGHCATCQKQMIKLGIELHDWKTAETAAGEFLAAAQGVRDVAVAHYQVGLVLMYEGLDRHRDEFFARAHDEMSQAATPLFPPAIFADGQILARLRQDEAAKARFQQFVKLRPEGDLERQRALRFISQPELARARMAPPFVVTTLDGQRVSLDDLKGKVVLLDFWATWCAPCREALPRLRKIASKFQGQPLVILSVSLDTDQQKWKEFIAKNGMTWPQYCDGGFAGPISRLFGINAIPHTFTIDADGVLQDEHVGDASIEGTLKKLLARAEELQTAAKPGQ